MDDESAAAERRSAIGVREVVAHSVLQPRGTLLAECGLSFFIRVDDESAAAEAVQCH